MWGSSSLRNDEYDFLVGNNDDSIFVHYRADQSRSTSLPIFVSLLFFLEKLILVLSSVVRVVFVWGLKQEPDRDDQDRYDPTDLPRPRW